MNSILSTESPDSDSWPLWVALFLAAALGFLSFKDLPAPRAQAVTPASLGYFRIIQGQGRVKRSNELLWEPIVANRRLFYGERVLIGPDSRAVMILADGSQLSLEESTQIDFSPEARITEGRVRRIPAPDGDSFRFKLQNRLYEATPDASFRVSLDEIAVVGGSLRFEEGQTRYQIREGEEISLKKSDLIAIRRSSFTLQSPKSGEELVVEPFGEIKFSWKVDPTISANSPLELEVAGDPSFTEEKRSLRIGATHPPLENVSAVMHLPPLATKRDPSKLFWRVRALNSDQVSASEWFTVRSNAR